MIAVALLLLLGLMLLSIPVAASLGLLGLSLSEFYAFLPLHRATAQMAWNAGNDSVLLAVPLFILLGEILLRSGMAERMYGAMVPWLSWLPGGLMHSNIGACTMFAATCGSSVATAATVGTVAIEQIERYGYNERLFLGTLAAGGTLGILIPPSINMIVYGALTNTSIPKLYLAGFIPGFLLAGLFMLTTYIACRLRPAWGGRKIVTSWADRVRVLPDLVPPLLIFVLVVGVIYTGWATPSESAALGVLAAAALAAWNRRLNAETMRAAIEGTMKTTGMAMAILTASYFLNFVITSIGLTRQISDAVLSLQMSPLVTLLWVIVFYLILGCFMETLSMMIATVPIIAPVVFALGYDPVWFGILVILLIETAMITPPVGINLFVVQGLRKRGGLNDVIIGTLPFVGTLLVMIALLVAFPNIAMFLPNAFND
ncbi:MAG: TRAP transporter large permease [Betaproteobacteria bacterium]|nr:TRAP transporter large permease [Betaproteobacteria bacterium]